MLRVTVEMVPYGIEAGTRTLGIMELTNLETDGHNNADYGVNIFDSHEELAEDFFLSKFNRDRGFWSLIYEALKEAGYNKKDRDPEEAA